MTKLQVFNFMSIIFFLYGSFCVLIYFFNLRNLFLAVDSEYTNLANFIQFTILGFFHTHIQQVCLWVAFLWGENPTVN